MTWAKIATPYACVKPRRDLDRIDRTAGGGRRLSDRARGRIARTLFEDRTREKEPQLYALLGEIVEIAHMVERRHGVEWYADANANNVFATAVADQILSLNPRNSAEAFTEEKSR